ncbi:Ras GTPase [Reticulomyxa filosa]|uniref:Ras GTPase n=1 Tax=Reticulomyxa filosa TaxID=46433 RepID=X6M6W5_RETFI|nr:Ras GTPase [Reticulomyxa filosa]|eukprot:ETO09733.1 Ras GTPase [Reticulomyxa filosa]
MIQQLKMSLAMKNEWIKEGDGFIIVYSITSEDSFQQVSKFRDLVVKIKDKTRIPIYINLYMYARVLTGSKCDLTEARQVSIERGSELAKEWDCAFYESSAKEKINVEIIFQECIREIRRICKNEIEKSQKIETICCNIL